MIAIHCHFLLLPFPSLPTPSPLAARSAAVAMGTMPQVTPSLPVPGDGHCDYSAVTGYHWQSVSAGASTSRAASDCSFKSDDGSNLSVARLFSHGSTQYCTVVCVSVNFIGRTVNGRWISSASAKAHPKNCTA